MKKISPIRAALSALLVSSFLLQSFAFAELQNPFPAWAYDAGPNPNDKMGKELIDINSRIPYFPGISKEVMGSQKFRPAFGPIPWRMRQEPNSVKILFIGQDGTHIAEAAGRPATAGFGGRAQDLAKYFGVDSSAAFINTYAFTIKGQYGSFSAPIVKKVNGKEVVTYSSLVDNQLWLMTQDQESPVVQWRNDLISWIIRNNKDSLKLIVLFGGGARDAAGAFVEANGGKVGTNLTESDLANIRVPEMDLTGAGGNNEAPYPFNKSGKDLYADVLGRPVVYSPTMAESKAGKESADFISARKSLSENASKFIPQMVFSGGGIKGSGLIHPAQLGGYDMDDKMEINGRKTISLKGLKVAGVTIDHDILIAQLPHPTRLSMMKKDEAAVAVGKGLEAFKPYVSAGWKIPADPGLSNNFAAGKEYEYARADMGPEYYDFGAPASRMVNVSTASRMGAPRPKDPKKPTAEESALKDAVINGNVIIFGTRDKANFKPAQIIEMANALPSSMPANEEMWTARPRMTNSRYVFDAGPGEKYAKIMKENLPKALIDAHATNRDFGHYRGTFKNPQVVILADPDGYDDLITARALTGSRGQFLHGLMTNLGVKDQYLVLKTAPFSKEKDWDFVLAQTRKYREAILKAVLSESKPKLILADGESAAQELTRIFGSSAPCPVIHIARDSAKKDAGLVEALDQIKRHVPDFGRANERIVMSDIPRTHLSYYARIWEGTSGDRVITSTDAEFQGSAFAEVAPKWAFMQKYVLPASDAAGAKRLNDRLEKNNLRKGEEPIPSFLNRRGITATSEHGLEFLDDAA